MSAEADIPVQTGGAATDSVAVADSAGGASSPSSVAPAGSVSSTPTPAWSLDTWDGQWGEALPEKVRTAAEAFYAERYKGHVAPDDAAALREAVKTAEANVRELKAASLRGSPFLKRELEEAKAALDALKAEQAEYAGKWGEKTFADYRAQIEADWQKAKTEANEAYSKALDEHMDRQIRALFPWAHKPTEGAPNAAFDPVKYAAAEQVANVLTEAGVLEDIPELVGYHLAERIAGPHATARLRTWITTYADTGDIHAAFKALDPVPTRGPSAAGSHARAVVQTRKPSTSDALTALTAGLRRTTDRVTGTAEPR